MEAWRRDRWDLLAAFEVDQRSFAAQYRLVCDGCHLECAGRSYPIPPLNSHAWPACPVSLLREDAWQHIVRTYNAKQVCPLSPWPSGYAAWVVDGLLALESAFSRKRDAEMKQAARAPAGGAKWR